MIKNRSRELYLRVELRTSSLPRKCSTTELIQQKIGAENGAQTRDPQLGRLVLYQLSYFRKSTTEWVVMDSNHRRHSQQIYSLPHLATLVTTLILTS